MLNPNDARSFWELDRENTRFAALASVHSLSSRRKEWSAPSSRSTPDRFVERNSADIDAAMRRGCTDQDCDCLLIAALRAAISSLTFSFAGRISKGPIFTPGCFDMSAMA